MASSRHVLAIKAHVPAKIWKKLKEIYEENLKNRKSPFHANTFLEQK